MERLTNNKIEKYIKKISNIEKDLNQKKMKKLMN